MEIQIEFQRVKSVRMYCKEQSRPGLCVCACLCEREEEKHRSAHKKSDKAVIRSKILI